MKKRGSAPKVQVGRVAGCWIVVQMGLRQLLPSALMWRLTASKIKFPLWRARHTSASRAKKIDGGLGADRADDYAGDYGVEDDDGSF